ncbi:MAG: hypothetical protein ABIH87_04685 [bacterium]
MCIFKLKYVQRKLQYRQTFLFAMWQGVVSRYGKQRKILMSDRISEAAMVHLEEELGPELARIAFDPSNTSLMREVVQKIKDGTMKRPCRQINI